MAAMVDDAPAAPPPAYDDLGLGDDDDDEDLELAPPDDEGGWD